MSQQDRLRELIDRLNKQKPNLPTGGDNRTLAEALNTSAIAKGQAIDRNKKGKVAKTLPLRELQSKR
jgi:hypothetical protein